MDGSKENGRRKKMKINRTRERILDKSIELFNRKQASNVSTVQISTALEISREICITTTPTRKK